MKIPRPSSSLNRPHVGRLNIPTNFYGSINPTADALGRQREFRHREQYIKHMPGTRFGDRDRYHRNKTRAMPSRELEFQCRALTCVRSRPIPV
jgi:hypothetical protein